MFNQSFITRGIPGLITFPSKYAYQKKSIKLFNFTFSHLNPFNIDFLIIKFQSDLSKLENYFSDKFGELSGVPIDFTQKDFSFSNKLNLSYSLKNFSGFIELEKSTEKFSDKNYGIYRRNFYSLTTLNKLKLFNNKIFLTTSCRYDKYKNFNYELSPAFSVNYIPLEYLKLTFNMGKAFRMPDFNELYYNEGYITGNPDLKPEYSKSYEFDLLFNKKNLSFSLSLFNIDIKNLIQYVLISGFRYKPLNIGKSRIKGLEISFNYKPFQFFNINTTYTLQDPRDLTPEPNTFNKIIPGRYQKKLFLQFELTHNKFKIFTNMLSLSGNYLTRSNTKKLPPRKNFDTGFTYSLKKNLSFTFQIKNLTNEFNYDFRGLPLPTRSFFIKMNYKVDFKNNIY